MKIKKKSRPCGEQTTAGTSLQLSVVCERIFAMVMVVLGDRISWCTRHTWQAPNGFCGDPGRQHTTHARQLDLVLHTVALKTFPRIEQVSTASHTSTSLYTQAL